LGPSLSGHLPNTWRSQPQPHHLPFARYKGEAENALLAAGFPCVYIFRPAYIYPVEARKEPNFSYRLWRSIYPFFRLVFPNQVIRADDWPERWLIFRTDHIAGKRLGKNVAESIRDTILLPR
jgi:hypothetical protein